MKVRKFFLGCGLALLLVSLAVVLIAYFVGKGLSESYAARGETVVAIAPTELWAALADFEQHPRGGPQVQGVERLPDVDGRPSWVEDLGETRMTVTATEWDPPRSMVLELTDSVVPMGARMTFALTPDGAGSTRLAFTNAVTIREGTWHTPFFRFVMTMTDGARSHMSGFLGDLHPALDVGQITWSDAPE